MKSKAQREIERQEELVKNLKSKVETLGAIYADRWDDQKGYIITSACVNEFNGEETTGYDFHVLTEDDIAHRVSGDYRDDGEWEVMNPEEFLQAILIDAEEILAGMIEERDEKL